jgi:hypothetical protein
MRTKTLIKGISWLTLNAPISVMTLTCRTVAGWPLLLYFVFDFQFFFCFFFSSSLFSLFALFSYLVFTFFLEQEDPLGEVPVPFYK